MPDVPNANIPDSVKDNGDRAVDGVIHGVQGAMSWLDDLDMVAVKIHPDATSLILILDQLRRLKVCLSMAEGAVETQLTKCWPKATPEWADSPVGLATLRSGAERKAWDADRLWAVLVSRLDSKMFPDMAHIVDLQSGADGDLSAMLQDFATELRKSVTASWKVTGLRAEGIDPNLYCDVSWGTKNVQTPTIKPEDL